MSKLTRIGVPTMFEGTLYRSRTEARWAALMKSFGWEFTYEPFDLTGYIPDFEVRLPRKTYILEVKSTDEDFDVAMAKLDMSGWDGHAMVVGHGLDGTVCGVIREHDGPGWHWCELEIFRCSNWNCISPLAVEGSWECRHCGAREAHKLDFDIESAWAAATNRVQWRPGQE